MLSKEDIRSLISLVSASALFACIMLFVVPDAKVVAAVVGTTMIVLPVTTVAAYRFFTKKTPNQSSQPTPGS